MNAGLAPGSLTSQNPDTVPVSAPSQDCGPESGVYPLSPYPRSGTPRHSGRAKWGKRLQNESFLLYQRGEKTIAEIADTLNVREHTVRRRKLGLTKRQQRIHDARILYERGLRVEAIAEHLGVKPVIVKRYLREGKDRDE
jgi:hypothetical protein